MTQEAHLQRMAEAIDAYLQWCRILTEIRQQEVERAKLELPEIARGLEG